MKSIAIYILGFLLLLSFLIAGMLNGYFPPWIQANSIPVYCILSGGFGGVLYCLRGIYLNFSVRKQWDKDYVIWYILRPIVSMISGGISYVFLKSGLLILEAKTAPEAVPFGFLALAFVAGLNVDKFIEKIEKIAQVTWGIEPSRESSKDKPKN